MKDWFRKKEPWEKRYKEAIPITYGRIAMFAISAVLVINAALNFLATFGFASILLFIFTLGIAAGLYKGAGWVRYFVLFFLCLSFVSWFAVMLYILGNSENFPFPPFMLTVNFLLTWVISFTESLAQDGVSTAAKAFAYTFAGLQFLFCVFSVYTVLWNKSATKFLNEQRERLDLMT
jgi:hypothetical protein